MISLSRICLKLARFLVKIAIFGGGATSSIVLITVPRKRRAWLYCQKSLVILPEECGYIAGRVRLYCRKSAVILPKECDYIAEECGYTFAKIIVATFVCTADARTPLGPIFLWQVSVWTKWYFLMNLRSINCIEMWVNIDTIIIIEKVQAVQPDKVFCVKYFIFHNILFDTCKSLLNYNTPRSPRTHSLRSSLQHRCSWGICWQPLWLSGSASDWFLWWGEIEKS